MSEKSNPLENPEKWLTLAESAKRMGVNTHTIWNMAKKGLIRKWVMGIRKCKYSLDDIETMIARNK